MPKIQLIRVLIQFYRRRNPIVVMSGSVADHACNRAKRIGG
jgi:hypothetical protein